MATLKAAAGAGQPGFATRRAGYIVSVFGGAVLLYGINVWPGWQAVPFLTEDLRLVLGLVNASIIVSLVANVLFLALDPPWFKALGDAITTSVGLVALVRLWQVFPVDFGPSSFNWELVARIVLVVGLVGSSIALLVALAEFVRAAVQHGPGHRAGQR